MFSHLVCKQRSCADSTDTTTVPEIGVQVIEVLYYTNLLHWFKNFSKVSLSNSK